jgi:triosephosphate isomerase
LILDSNSDDKLKYLAMMKNFIAANWKMNMTIPEARQFLDGFIPSVQNVQEDDIVIAPPFTALTTVADAIQGTNIRLAAQDVYWEEEGAYTGEVSSRMLLDAGCQYVIIGHSERRHYFNEDDVTVNRKIRAAKEAGLGIIFCVGESLKEREANKTFDVIKKEVEAGLVEVSPENLVVAYEPIWAIGTGKTATVEQAQEIHAYIRKILYNLFGNNSDEIRIIYGGSVTKDNVDALLSSRDINGALVGGASLTPESFSRIVHFKKEK